MDDLDALQQHVVAASHSASGADSDELQDGGYDEEDGLSHGLEDEDEEVFEEEDDEEIGLVGAESEDFLLGHLSGLGLGGLGLSGLGADDVDEEHVPPGHEACRIDDESIKLLPGESVIPGSRLANLFEALQKNRGLQASLSGVLEKVDRLISRNWEARRAVVQPLNQQPKPGPKPNPEVQTSRWWCVNGCLPQPEPGTEGLMALVSKLPTSFDRMRWSRAQVDGLKRGVLVEVQSMLTQRNLDARKEGYQAEFDRIKTVDLDSDEAQELVGQFSQEQWEHVSLSLGSERGPDECRIFYRHTVAPLRPWTLNESAKLRELVVKHKERNWEAVAAELGHRRSPAQCLQRYLKVNQPKHVRSRVQWTAEDDELLRQMVAQHGTSWVKISAAMDGRFDRHQLRDRWHGQTRRQHDRVVGAWGDGEDERLLQAVEHHGPRWATVAAVVKTRTAKQCSERYNNILRPDLDRSRFTEAEKDLVLSLCEEHMKAHGRIIWKLVVKRFPGRTDEKIRRVWRAYKKFGRSYVSKRRLRRDEEDWQSTTPEPELESEPELELEAEHQRLLSDLDSALLQDGGALFRPEPPVGTLAELQDGGQGVVDALKQEAPLPPEQGGVNSKKPPRKRRKPAWASDVLEC